MNMTPSATNTRAAATMPADPPVPAPCGWLCARQVVCAYHGWRFEKDGSCSSIPQALDPKAAATACASQRSCATAFPTQQAGGLLWVWPDTSSSAAAEAEGERARTLLLAVCKLLSWSQQQQQQSA